MRKNFLKRIFAMGATVAVLGATLIGCGAENGNGGGSVGTNESGSSGGSTNNAIINVISREEGSGTRSAFTELMGILDENEKDATVVTAEVTQSTAVMIQSVEGDKNAIGYISLGSLKNNPVKALKIDGVAATVDNVKSGEYKVSRPFNIAVKEAELSEQSKDFIDFIMSTQGQKIIEEDGYIPVEASGSYSPAKMSGKINIAGSTSVAPVMEKLAEEYMKLNPDVSITVTQSGSSAGMTSAIEGACDIGMASREVKASEKEKGLKEITIAKDGIAVIVNEENSLDNITSEQVKQIYMGGLTKWSEVQ